MSSKKLSVAGDGLVATGGWLLIFGLVIAPLAYGGFPEESMRRLAIYLLAVTAVAGTGWILKWRAPRAPWWMIGSSIALAAWVLIGLRWAGEQTLSISSQEMVAWHLQRWPASTSWPEPWVGALLVAGLCGAVILTADLARRKRWRLRFLGGLALGGVAVAILGFAQIATGAESMYWKNEYGDQRDVMPGHFFGSFFHHSVAGAFLNLSWMAAAALGLSLWMRGEKALRTGAFLWGICALGIFAAVFVNVSKAAMVLALGMALAGLVWPGKQIIRRSRRHARFIAPVAALVLLIGSVGIWWQSDRFAVAGERWSEFFSAVQSLPQEIERTGQVPTAAPFDRLAGLDIAMTMAGESGWKGFGPETWRTTFPGFMGEEPLEPFWLWMQFAHQDYLQAVIEWGWVGAFFAGVVVVGGFIRGIVSFRRLRGQRLGGDGVLLYVVILALAAVLLHAMGDFPLQIPAVQLAVAVLVGIACSSAYWRVEEEPKKSEHRRGRSGRGGSEQVTIDVPSRN